MDSADVTEIKRHFNVVAERLEGRIQLVAEALANLNAKLDRVIASLRSDMHEQFDETRAMIRLS